MTENRVCQSCRVEKPLTEFRVRRIYKAGLTTYWPECNACLSADFPESVVIYSGPIVLRPEALAANLPRYFTGNPCDYGHIAQRMTSSKQCHACLSGLTKVRDKTPEHKAKKNTRRNAKRPRILKRKELRIAHTLRCMRMRTPQHSVGTGRSSPIEFGQAKRKPTSRRSTKSWQETESGGQGNLRLKGHIQQATSPTSGRCKKIAAPTRLAGLNFMVKAM